MRSFLVCADITPSCQNQSIQTQQDPMKTMKNLGSKTKDQQARCYFPISLCMIHQLSACRNVVNMMELQAS